MSKSISIHIGMEYIDPEYYNGNDGKLATCGKDSLDMQDIAVTQNFESTQLLLNEGATRDTVKEAIELASKTLTSGDMLFISYSGHGSLIPDSNSDEADAKDEAWCLYDGFLLDDELYALWTLFEEDVRIFMISDSCHSGTMTKAAPGENIDSTIVPKFFPEAQAKKVYKQHKSFYDDIRKMVAPEKEKDLKASVKLIAGCQDDESSFILPNATNSLLTAELNKVWNAGKFVGTTIEFFEQIKEQVVDIARKNKIYQTPNIFTIGKENTAFDIQRPFGIYG